MFKTKRSFHNEQVLLKHVQLIRFIKIRALFDPGPTFINLQAISYQDRDFSLILEVSFLRYINEIVLMIWVVLELGSRW